MNITTLNEVFSVYEYLKDSIKVTRRSINKDQVNLQNRTVFFAEPKILILEKMSNVDDELDDIMVLALFASFERELRSSIQSTFETKFQIENKTLENISKVTIDGIERWSVVDMINILEDVVSNNIRSQTKQIYEYRNWVAHGKNSSKLPSIQTEPKTVYYVLNKFILEVQNSI